MPKIKQPFVGTVAFDARKKRSMLEEEHFYATGFLESREGHTAVGLLAPSQRYSMIEEEEACQL